MGVGRRRTEEEKIGKGGREEREGREQRIGEGREMRRDR